MKKNIFAIILVLFVVGGNIVNIYADDKRYDLNDYYLIINRINEKYNSNLSIYDKNSFFESDIASEYNYNYDEYISKIINTDISLFELECEDVAMMNMNHINVKLDLSQKSTLGSKTLKFNSSRNSMTLTYKYIGTKFDTSYKPSVSVKKLSSIYYFTMTSYKGSFKNSNKTYSVIAKGKIYTSFGVADGKSFTVDFNL